MFWHGRSVEMAVAFFPGDAPLVKHVINSYQKHYTPSNEIIPEDEEISTDVMVVKSSYGIDYDKASPLIRETRTFKPTPVSKLDMPTNDYIMIMKNVVEEIYLTIDNEDKAKGSTDKLLETPS